MMERLGLKDLDYFPSENHEISLNHYDDFKMHKDIIDVIGKLGYSLTPSKLTYSIYITLHQKEKRDIRLIGFEKEHSFISYFPLILDHVHEKHPNEPDKKKPYIIFVTSTPESAMEVYDMINEFTNDLKIVVALSHQGRKMEMNIRHLRAPFHILGIIRFDDSMYLILMDIHLWNSSTDYITLMNEMIKCGLDPVDKCSIIAISENFDNTSKNIYSSFSFKNHYDFTPNLN
ncbi:P-loop containing nucleoside triphosphate hydrolase domain-containing protein [Strongyloides ratti]|uniref:P-loop containing Nucleoside triphosphate hydrolase domain-containing protein n=1 Tax=Strongyloides ratti TaxID=34506 RepID=A0A090KZI4_STRRB|nr:P-loop containing nucleoside triphosphate hydrolase domain-containing protein [Strongyloides ratti]CEF62945.1 P-loop containing nucleoside triphosphate hydrolase domain-containing protein [Strongyloides ratti]